MLTQLENERAPEKRSEFFQEWAAVNAKIKDAPRAWASTDRPSWRRSAAIVLLSLVVGIVAALMGGCACVTEREYRDAVQAWDAYRQKTSPIYRANVQVDPTLDDQSKKNRLAWDEDNGLACEAAKQRAGLIPAPAPKDGQK